jgi:hypothetical protein
MKDCTKAENLQSQTEEKPLKDVKGKSLKQGQRLIRRAAIFQKV